VPRRKVNYTKKKKKKKKTKKKKKRKKKNKKKTLTKHKEKTPPQMKSSTSVLLSKETTPSIRICLKEIGGAIARLISNSCTLLPKSKKSISTLVIPARR